MLFPMVPDENNNHIKVNVQKQSSPHQICRGRKCCHHRRNKERHHLHSLESTRGLDFDLIRRAVSPYSYGILQAFGLCWLLLLLERAKEENEK